MQTYAIIFNGVVANLVDYATAPSSPPPGFDEGYAAVLANGAGIGWSYANGAFTPPAAPAPTQAQLVAVLNAAASAACAFIVGQTFPDPSHQTAFQNAAAIVNGNAGAAPTTGQLATKFAALATVYGMSASAFAALVVVFQGASLDLSTALTTLWAATGAATTGAQLATALTAFETAIGNVVAEINAAGPPGPTVAPAAIVIAGINA